MMFTNDKIVELSLRVNDHYKKKVDDKGMLSIECDSEFEKVKASVVEESKTRFKTKRLVSTILALLVIAVIVVAAITKPALASIAIYSIPIFALSISLVMGDAYLDMQKAKQYYNSIEACIQEEAQKLYDDRENNGVVKHISEDGYVDFFTEGEWEERKKAMQE